MPFFTLVATGYTETADPEDIDSAVRAALASVGVELIPCAWAPDLDTVADAADLAYGDLTLIDLN
jgi:hypothetical protein